VEVIESLVCDMGAGDCITIWWWRYLD